MSAPAVCSATSDQREAIQHTITLAFAADPVNRWYLPDATTYLQFFPKVVSGFLDLSIDAGTCFVTEGIEGAALWLPPGAVADEEAMEALLAQAAPQSLIEPLYALFGAIADYHPHDEDCWYLPLVGVDPAHQGKGIGAALMKHATQRIDQTGALSYLESSTPRNVPLYQRHGFEPMGEIVFGDARDIVTPMIRSRMRAASNGNQHI